MNPLAKYLFTLSAVIVAYCAYIRTAVPLLEGPVRSVQRRTLTEDYPDVAETIDKSHLPSVVPAGAWELGNCKTLLTPQGTIYFEYWEPVDDEGTYQLMPFTMVVNDPVNKIRDGSQATTEPEKAPAPIVLRALDGARLRFSKPLTARSKKQDIELNSAMLDGQVTLYRPASVENGEQELRIVSDNIQITQSQIFTLNDVHFAFGQHHGSGRNLSIQLTHDTPEQSFSNVSGISQMELASVKELVLQPTNAAPSIIASRGDLNDADSADGSGTALSNQTSPLQISCEGPFVFQMNQNKAWFRDKVVVTQLDQYRDRLECSSLQIELSKESTETAVEKLIAVGSPETPATITSNSQQTIVVGEELIFEVANSIVKAAGSQPVSIRSPRFAIESPTLEYQLAQNGKLGNLVAEGPGILRGVQEGRPTEPFEVNWNSQLTTRTLDADRIQIDIEERASVKFNHRNGIWADDIQFVLWQTDGQQDKETSGRWQYQPSQVTATGNVLLTSTKVSGFTKKLIANWPKPITNPVANPMTPDGRHSVSYRGPIAVTAPPQDDFRSLPDASTTPTLHFKGDQVIANMQGDLNNMQLKDIVVDGSLILESKGQDQQPFSITGDSMKLLPQANDLYHVTIKGQDQRLASFKTDGFDIEGRNLQLDQTANTIWVEGKGNLQIDPAEIDTATTAGSQSQFTGATVSWQGGMVFDGAKIYFEHFVKLVADRRPDSEGTRSQIKADCEALTLELTQPIRLEQAAGEKGKLGKSPAQIKRMTFINQVNQTKRAFRLVSHEENDLPIAFQNATLDRNGKMTELQKLRVPMASVEATSGDIVTSGPGEALLYRYSNGESPMAKLGSAKPTPTSTAPKLTCVHTRFDGALTASTEDGKLEMERNTRSAWGDVKSFDQLLDPDQPSKLPVGSAVLKADVLKMAQWTPRNAEQRRELHAIGNTSIQSELFEAVADRMTYTDVTDVLVIEGRPPANARLSYRRNAKSRPEVLRAAKVMYRISDQWTEVFDIRSIDAGMPDK